MRNLNACLLVLPLAWATGANAQAIANISCTDPAAEAVMKGLYDPSTYAASNVISDHQQILCELRTRVSADSLKGYLQRMEQFHTRHSHSDTVSNLIGIGAARRWAFAKLQSFSALNEGRLIPAYLQFDYNNGECGDGPGWRNVLGVLPGSDISNPSLMIVEGHFDTRCESGCDTLCLAAGMEDNGSGSALVLELARVMSRYTFDHTIVFMLTTGEEQGLVGAEAMATWCQDNGIAIKGVQNNDIVGGVICGATSSDPGCEVEGERDSLQVRLFSFGAPSATCRGFARAIELYYQEKLQAHVPVPMTVSIMPLEDREDRGGDHIPFRELGYRSMRFTSANEHGDAGVDNPEYHDRQHTSDDILGVDTDGDLVVDSFFVDFNYLARNTVINGMSAALMALGPEPPEFEVLDEPTGLRVTLNGPPGTMAWRIGVRSISNSLGFNALYRTTSTSFNIPGLAAQTSYFVSTASIDSAGIMSPFSSEVLRQNDVVTAPGTVDDLPYGLACTPIGMAEAPRAILPRAWPVPLARGAMLHLEGLAPQDVTGIVGLDGRGWPLLLSRGTDEVLVATSHLASGVYVVRTATSGAVRFLVE